MKHSHIQTPRTLNECNWTPGYQSLSNKEPLWETIAGYILAIVIGISLAMALFFGLSS
jgi:hypothetical protein